MIYDTFRPKNNTKNDNHPLKNDFSQPLVSLEDKAFKSLSYK